MSDASAYNHPSFNRDADKFARFPEAPHVGTVAPDFPLEDLDGGATVRLADLWRRDTVVMEFGSFS